MGDVVYEFGRFRLNPLTRELTRGHEFITLPASAFDCLVYLVEHRERPIGRDELISAVWGRTDVSDNLLAQTILRLRRELGDDGNEQHTIRTIPRVGYRWMAETKVVPKEQHVVPKAQQNVAAIDPVETVQKLSLARQKTSRDKRRVFWISMALAVSILAIGGTLLLRTTYLKKAAATSPGMFAHSQLMVVFPAEVKASNDWQWLQLGVMALVSDRLREAKVPTMANQAVVRELNARNDGSGKDVFSDPQLGVSVRIKPHVSYAAGQWLVRLEARGSSNRVIEVQASAKDVLTAGAIATDRLLAQFDLSSSASEHTPVAQQLLVQRITAARLSGQWPLAQQLIDQAPADLKNVPIMRYYAALLEFDSGHFAEAKKQFRALLAQTPVQPETAVFRGRILEWLAVSYQHTDQNDESKKLYDQAIPLLQGEGNESYLGYAYANRADTETTLLQFDQASDDIGRARVIYARTGDIQGAAITDYETSHIFTNRGQIDTALSFLKKSYDEFSKIGEKEQMIKLQAAIAELERMLLRFDDALKTSDGFWPLPSFIVDRPMRFYLTLVRAGALANVGRLDEAENLTKSVLKQISPAAEPLPFSWAQRILASVAMGRGNYALAAQAARLAKSPEMEKSNDTLYVRAWLILIQALQNDGKVKEAGLETKAMRTWANTKISVDESLEIFAGLAEARQSEAEGRQEQALQQFAVTMTRAQKFGVPELVVSVGQSYAFAALDAGRIDQATVIGGTLAPWAGNDVRAAQVEARVYDKLGQKDASMAAYKRASQLAGERILLPLH